MGVPSIQSERLELVSLCPPLIEGLLADREAPAPFSIPAGWPGEHDRRFLRFRLDQMHQDPEWQRWLVRAIVLRCSDRPMIGHAGFHGPPGTNAPGRPDTVELGYTVFEEFRGKGHATEAVRALMRWAEEEHGIRHFVASITPDNAPSLAIVRKLGFAQTGRHWDEEDGEELEFELALEELSTR